MRKITIDPITRLEGHGKIEIFLDKDGNAERAYLQVPELRGFERFCIGRPAEEMPRITPRICGVCPTAHHMASTKALDAMYGVRPTPAGETIRRLMYNTFMFEDHMLHFFYLGGPDFIVGPQVPAPERNILGVVAKVGREVAGRVIRMRRECRGILATIGGKAIHPVCGLPGGVSKALTEEDRARILPVARDAVEFAQFAIKSFDDMVLKDRQHVELITGDAYRHETYYMGLVDGKNRVDFYDGRIRIVTPQGREFARFPAKDYMKHIAEHVEPWSYMKFCYLRKVGWKGFVDGKDSGVYRAAPLARLNAADGMSTPLAQAEYERMYYAIGEKPVHSTLAMHWARLIEALQAAESMAELSEDPLLTDPYVRAIPAKRPSEGVGAVEAPRGTLIHHYQSGPDGLMTGANLIVATQNNAAAISMSIHKAAQSLIRNGVVSEGLLNMVEMAFRAYDPCLACATHALGETPMIVDIFDHGRRLVRSIRRD